MKKINLLAFIIVIIQKNITFSQSPLWLWAEGAGGGQADFNSII